MRFRTEIGKINRSFSISHDDRMVLIGSCFADNIGERLAQAGFQAIHNPLGPLFNPASISRVIQRGEVPYSAPDFTTGPDGILHCLDFANRYQAGSSDELAAKVNADYMPFARAVIEADVIIVTFGNDKVYEYGDTVAGNCHKLAASTFTERYLGLDEICGLWRGLIPKDKRVIFTLSPVRYIGDGLARSCLSKATLRVAIDRICREGGYDYFPAYEIVNDDLRDYRFYADDLKHPSDMAVDYIYEHFAETYFTKDTILKADEYRRAALRSAHIPLL